MKKEVKAQRIDELKELFETNGTYYLFNYNKMTVAQATALRKNLRKQGSALKIVKNRLALRSVPGPLADDLRPVFSKPRPWRTPTATRSSWPKRCGNSRSRTRSWSSRASRGRDLRRSGTVRSNRQAARPDGPGGQGRRLAAPMSGFLRCLRAPLGDFGILLNQLKAKKESA